MMKLATLFFFLCFLSFHANGECPCESVSSQDVNKRIPSTGFSGETVSTLATTLAGKISSVQVLNIAGTHTYHGDLTFYLSHEETSIILWSGDNCPGKDFDFNLQDDAQEGSCVPTNGGFYTSKQPLAAFNGLRADGQWILRIKDVGSDDAGTLLSWKLKVCACKDGEFIHHSSPKTFGVPTEIEGIWSNTEVSLEFKRNMVTATIPGRFENRNGKFSLSRNGPVKSITMQFGDKETLHGIYKLEEEQMKFAISEDGSLPSGFENSKLIQYILVPSNELEGSWMGTSVSQSGFLEEYTFEFRGRTLTVTQITDGDIENNLVEPISTVFRDVTVDTLLYPKQILIGGEAQMIYDLEDHGKRLIVAVSRDGGKPKRNEFSHDNAVDKTWQLMQSDGIEARQVVESTSGIVTLTTAFPDINGNIGFANPANSPSLVFTDSETNSFIAWNPFTQRLSILSQFVLGVVVLGSVNSFCDIPRPTSFAHLNFDVTISTIAPSPGQAYVFRMGPFPFSFLTIWISDESNFPALGSNLPASLAFTYQYWYQPTQATTAPTCVPHVQRVTPNTAWHTGSIIHVYGFNFGRDLSRISLNINCQQREMVVPTRVIRCVASSEGKGTVPVRLTVGTQLGSSQAQLTFRTTCFLRCPSNSYPNPACSGCLRLPGLDNCNLLTKPPTMVPLETLGRLYTDAIERAQSVMNADFFTVANRYRNSFIESFPLQKYYISKATVQFSYANATTPGLVMPLAPEIQEKEVARAEVEVCLKNARGCDSGVHQIASH